METRRELVRLGSWTNDASSGHGTPLHPRLTRIVFRPVCSRVGGPGPWGVCSGCTRVEDSARSTPQYNDAVTVVLVDANSLEGETDATKKYTALFTVSR